MEQMKLDFVLTRNLTAMLAVVSLLSLVLADVYAHSETTAKRQRFSQVEQGMKMVGVMRAGQLRYR
jgi:hypothetical protein